MATSSHASDDNQTKTFKTFPEFSKLTLADRGQYEEIIRHYPPIADVSFPSLMSWWNPLGSCAAATMNGNLVLSYWLPGDERASGLSFFGVDYVDESICEIFDYLRDKGEATRLVHVPEFVVGNMKHPELFQFVSERDYDECVLATTDLYPLERATSYMRRKVERFLRAANEDHVKLAPSDLRLSRNQDTLCASAREWEKKGKFHDVGRIDREAFEFTVANADVLGVENICLYVKGRLAAVQLYQRSSDDRYIVGTFLRFVSTFPGVAEFMLYALARSVMDRGVSYINYEQDLGLSWMRAQKLALGPRTFLRKYTVEPAR